MNTLDLTAGTVWRALVAAIAAVLMLAGCGPLHLPGAAAVASAHASASSPPPTAGSAQDLQQAFVRVVKQVGPSVVQIETPSGLGSGVVFDSHGDIVSNDHVIGSGRSLVVTTADGKRYNATLVGAFPPDDLAIIHVSAQLSPATFADSSKLQVGDLVMAVGNPLGLQSSVTEGIVSAVGRTVSEGQGGATLPDVIQTSAAVNPGNSGGALVDLSGQVVGIPTLGATDPQLGGGAAPGIGFAISSNMAHDIATQIVKNGRVVNSHRAYLGIQAGNIGPRGVLVSAVDPHGPADEAGIRPGDIIAKIAGKATASVTDLASVLTQLDPGQQVTVELTHSDGAKASVKVTLAQYPG